MRSPKKRSLLDVNEHFEGEHNDKIHFLFSLAVYSLHKSLSAVEVAVDELEHLLAVVAYVLAEGAVVVGT